MLGDSPINPVLLSTDLAETKRFYHDKLGLEILSESEEAIVSCLLEAKPISS